jgi:hypothetical protein
MKRYGGLRVWLVLAVLCALMPMFGQSESYASNDLNVNVSTQRAKLVLLVPPVSVPTRSPVPLQDAESKAARQQSGLQRLTEDSSSSLQASVQNGIEVQTAAPMASDDEHDVDVANLEEGIPSPVEDAYVLPDDYFEAQGIINWGDADWGDWREYRLQFAAGLSSKWQGTAGVVFKDNDLDNIGDGDIFLKFMHQFMDRERDAGLFGVNLNFPAGQNYASRALSIPPFIAINERDNQIDVTLMGVYTRLLNVEKSERLHLEVKETFVRSAPMGYSNTQLFLGAGYDKRVGEDTLALASLCWVEAPHQWEDDTSVLQLGLRHQESRRFLWGAGLKIGLDWAAADWGLVWGAEYGL